MIRPQSNLKLTSTEIGYNLNFTTFGPQLDFQVSLDLNLASTEPSMDLKLRNTLDQNQLTQYLANQPSVHNWTGMKLNCNPFTDYSIAALYHMCGPD